MTYPQNKGQRAAGYQAMTNCNSHHSLKITCAQAADRNRTSEVPFHDAGHLGKVAPAGGRDAGGHRQNVPDVGAQEGRVLLQQGTHPHELGTLEEE